MIDKKEKSLLEKPLSHQAKGLIKELWMVKELNFPKNLLSLISSMIGTQEELIKKLKRSRIKTNCEVPIENLIWSIFVCWLITEDFLLATWDLVKILTRYLLSGMFSLFSSESPSHISSTYRLLVWVEGPWSRRNQ